MAAGFGYALPKVGTSNGGSVATTAFTFPDCKTASLGTARTSKNFKLAEVLTDKVDHLVHLERPIERKIVGALSVRCRPANIAGFKFKTLAIDQREPTESFPLSFCERLVVSKFAHRIPGLSFTAHIQGPPNDPDDTI
jgi:hypothetical protein